jgi:hypothetical protein
MSLNKKFRGPRRAPKTDQPPGMSRGLIEYITDIIVLF